MSAPWLRWEFKVLPGEDPEKLTDPSVVLDLVSRWVQPEEVAAPILFFCSPMASACTGTHVIIDCGLHIGAGHPARLACMDFRRPRPGRPGGIRYLFDCGALSDASLAGIVVQSEEIAEHRVADLRTALTMLRRPIRLRVRAATRGLALCYLEDGRPVPGLGTAKTRRPRRCNESRSRGSEGPSRREDQS